MGMRMKHCERLYYIVSKQKMDSGCTVKKINSNDFKYLCLPSRCGRLFFSSKEYGKPGVGCFFLEDFYPFSPRYEEESGDEESEVRRPMKG